MLFRIFHLSQSRVSRGLIGVSSRYLSSNSGEALHKISTSDEVTNGEVEAGTSSLATNSNSVENKKLRHTKWVATDKPAKLNIYDAVDFVKKSAWANFDETVEIAVNLGVDPRKPNQSIKGVAVLPSGSGKVIRVAVFAQGNDVQAALDAGASVVGSDDLLARIQSGDLPFERVIATPEMMTMVSKVGKILGPRGMMPNPKMGTVTKDVTKAVKAAKAGSVQFRVEKQGIIQAGIGKVSFTKEALLDNVRSFMVAISDVKPENYKGKYLMGVHLSSSMGPGIRVDLPSVDPSNARFMLHPDEYTAK